MTLLFVLSLLIGATGGGLLLLDALVSRKDLRWPARLPIAFLLGCFFIHIAVYLFGRVRLDFASMSTLLLAFLVLGLVGLSRQPLKEGLRQLKSVSGWSLAEKSLLAALIVVGLIGFLQGMAPPNDYDSLMYHMALPQADIEEGRIVAHYKYALVHAFFPQLIEDFARLGLAVAGEPAAQLPSGLLTLAGVWATAALVLQMGASRAVALLAALMFLCVRAVVWEMASVEVEAAQAAYAVAALLALLAWLERPGIGLALLFGLLLGAGFNVKYPAGANAIALALSLLVAKPDWRKMMSHAPFVVLAAAISILPQSLFNFLETGNPFFPLFNSIFYPDGPRFFSDTHLIYGTGRGFLDLLIGPLALSAAPMRYFDGMILGAPYLIAFLPLYFFVRPTPRHSVTVVAGLALFYVIWFYLLSQQVRFLMPVLPQAAAIAAFGLCAFWKFLAPYRMLRLAFASLVALLAVNQALFVGIYAALRLPVAIGLQTPDAYHQTPTLTGAFYKTCRYVRENLKPGESYLSMIGPHSYYCPQKAAALALFPEEEKAWMDGVKPSPMQLGEFIRRFEDAGFRFVILPKGGENRRNESGAPVFMNAVFEGARPGYYVSQVIHGLSPVAEEQNSAVYDGRDVLESLKRLQAGQ